MHCSDKQLGNAVAVTLDTYAHVFEEFDVREDYAERESGEEGDIHRCRSGSEADARIRTADPFITSEVLYQLSYVGGEGKSSAVSRSLRLVRELDRDEIEEFLLSQRIARLGCHAGGETYVVPVIYAYGDGALVTVTQEGRKVAMLRENPRVCVEVDEYDTDGRGSWRSVIGYGNAEELAGDAIEDAFDPPPRAVRTRGRP